MAKLTTHPDKKPVIFVHADLYTKLFYSTRNGGQLVESLRTKIGKVHPNKARKDVDMEMFKKDAWKFNFEPDAKSLAKDSMPM